MGARAHIMRRFQEGRAQFTWCQEATTSCKSKGNRFHAETSEWAYNFVRECKIQ
jgi:hypothetical protein